MPIITELKTENNSISFELVNNIDTPMKIGLANAIRRTIISDVPTYCIDKSSIKFYDSYNEFTILNDEFLIDRLILIPFISDLEDIDYDNIVISCKKENMEENLINVYVKDFICKNSQTNETYDISKLCRYPEILFSKLANNARISFDCKLTKNTSEHRGAGFSPVSACSYMFKKDDKMIKDLAKDMNESDKQKFMTHNSQRTYEKNEIGEPKIYQFYYESIGFYDCFKILNMSLTILIDKFRNISNEFKNPESTIVSHCINKDDFYRFDILNVNETLGEPLQLYLSSNENVFYAGYIIEHPLKKSLLLKLKLKENNTLENVLLCINDTIELIIQILEQCVSDIQSK